MAEKKQSSNETVQQPLPADPVDRLRMLIKDMLEDAIHAFWQHPNGEGFSWLFDSRENLAQLGDNIYFLSEFRLEAVRKPKLEESQVIKRYGIRLDHEKLKKIYEGIAFNARTQVCNELPLADQRTIDQVLKELYDTKAAEDGEKL